MVGSIPLNYQNSPMIIVEVQGPENHRVARKAESVYPYNTSGKTPAGISYVKTDFNRKIRGARLHVADGAYPVYYTPGIANGRFGAKIFTLN